MPNSLEARRGSINLDLSGAHFHGQILSLGHDPVASSLLPPWCLRVGNLKIISGLNERILELCALRLEADVKACSLLGCGAGCPVIRPGWPARCRAWGVAGSPSGQRAVTNLSANERPSLGRTGPLPFADSAFGPTGASAPN